MKKYAFTFSGHETFSVPITGHSFLLRCMPGTYPFQRSYAQGLTVTPFTALTHISDVHGNEMYTGTIDKKHSAFSFTASGFVLCSKYLTHEPLDRLYLYPTERTRPSGDMRALLSSAALPEEPWQRARALCALVYQRLGDGRPYRPQNAEALCHTLIVLSRLSGIGARFVSGLTAGRSLPHCWAEVYCGGVWRALDPSAGTPVEEGYLKIAHGPDSGACAVSRGCFHDPEDTVSAIRDMHVQVTEHVIQTRDTVPHA